MAPSDLPLQHAAQLLQFLPHLTRWTRELVSQVSAGLELSLRQYAALRALQEGARSATDLARRWQVTPAVVTGVIDRLERRGLVRRAANPKDRRRLDLALTSKGLEMSRSVDDKLTRALAAHLAVAAPSDLLALSRTLAVLERALGPREPDAVASPARNERPGAGLDKPARRRPTRHVDTGERPRRLSRRVIR
ncbi:MAG: MarR family winged helix-turn-helix transcriptional regulator [Hyalangium sp.]|uniref:MarR family winged helix-turn-helix transcriptional regulator n=1 Tax=Hyalangium sp. TaxID=2028555 RepID=UPI00389AFF66